MTRNRKKDTTQTPMVEELRAAGFSVEVLHFVGRGFPDFIAGKGGINLLVEAKSPGGKFTPDEERWHALWRGQVVIAYAAEDVIREYERMMK